MVLYQICHSGQNYKERAASNTIRLLKKPEVIKNLLTVGEHSNREGETHRFVGLHFISM